MKKVSIKQSDIDSIIELLKHDGKSTSCSYRNYSLTARATDKTLTIRWFKRGTREPIEAELA